MSIRIDGIAQTNRNINRAISSMRGRSTERFITEFLIQVGARTAYYIPVDTSFLINSQFRNVRRAQQGWLGEIGYGADYAIPVHDGPQKNWKKGGASNKFLEKGFEETVHEDLDMIIKRNFKL